MGKLIILFGGLLTGLLLSGCTPEESTKHDVHHEEVEHDADYEGMEHEHIEKDNDNLAENREHIEKEAAVPPSSTIVKRQITYVF